MYFRFGAAVALILMIWGCEILLSNKSDRLRQEINAQHEQMEVMRDYQAHLRIRTARLSLLPSERTVKVSPLLKTEEGSKHITHERPVVPLLQIEH